MATEEVDTDPSMEEMVTALSGKLAAREAQMAALEIKIAKQQQYIVKLVGGFEAEQVKLKE